MEENIKQHIDTSSAEFKQGVEAGLNSEETSKNWQAGNELGQELKDEVENREPAPKRLFKEHALPLFMSGSSDGEKGNAQDEKDASEE